MSEGKTIIGIKKFFVFQAEKNRNRSRSDIHQLKGDDILPVLFRYMKTYKLTIE